MDSLLLPSSIAHLTASFPRFTPVSSLVGGFILSCSVNGLLLLTGSALGISGFFHRSFQLLLRPASATAANGDRLADAQKRTASAVALGLTAGLIGGGIYLGANSAGLQQDLGVTFFDSPSLTSRADAPLGLTTVLAGLLVGFGTKLGSGCTSGHFLCGLSRLSLRSITATASFFSVAVLTHLATSEAADVSTSSIRAAVAPALREIIASFGVLQVPLLVYAGAVPLALRLLPTTADARQTFQPLLALLSSFSIGVHFAFDLALTGMLRPSKVLGFLALSPTRISSGAWDPSLALVAVGGILPAATLWFGSVNNKVRTSRQGNKQAAVNPAYEPALFPSARWSLPTNPSLITPRLVVGSALFGIGWGLSGFCPGPVLVNLGATLAGGEGSNQVARYAAFTGFMAIGGWLGGKI